MVFNIYLHRLPNHLFILHNQNKIFLFDYYQLSKHYLVTFIYVHILINVIIIILILFISNIFQ